jgi:hypothetical protein
VSDMVGAKELVLDRRSEFVALAGNCNALMDEMREFRFLIENCSSKVSGAAAKQTSRAKYHPQLGGAARDVLRDR